MQLSQDLRTQNLQPHVENNSYFSFFSELSHSHWSVTTVETLVQMAIFLISVITNIGAFSLVVHERRRTDSTLFTLNLFVADLLFISTIPFIIAVRWTEAWTLGPVACHAVMYSICLSGSVTITTLAAISTDRLLAILKMESTPSLNLRRASGVLLLIWLFTAVAVLPLSLFSRVVTVVSFEQREMQICTLAWPHVRGEIIWNTTFVVLGYLLPGIGIVFSYGKILQIRQKSKKRLNSATSQGCAQLCPVSKRDYRLFRTLLILMVSFFFMWSPIFIFLILVRNLQVDVHITSRMFFWVVTFTLVNSALNPVLYSVYQLRHSFQKLCGTREDPTDQKAADKTHKKNGQ
ncbi:free fatty acid receptor 4 [Astyanax mexicanus]|uniref:Free fatty acid receptor 4 n=1 Tax=Astyanax mexicanus TaxID=7994 RepID=A0A8T2KLH6_ASTMX|nr:free fatty acid receptor 4 [Astyanax mexicanus]